MKRFVAVALLCLASSAVAGSVIGSKHDLSAKGPGPYRAKFERSACIFCHVSHRAGPTALSNLLDTTAQHRPYESTTLQARPGAPTGSSRLCLSCHDGTIALGRTRNSVIEMESGNRPIDPGRPSNLGTDLRKSHPVSMRGASGKARAPTKGDPVHLDGDALVQCTSCHDPHDEWRDPDVGKFLVKRSANSAICVSCHTSPGAPNATHLYSTEAYPDSAVASARAPSSGKLQPLRARTTSSTRTMAEVGCGMCHVPHGADSRGRLLGEGLRDDDICLRCHGKTTRPLLSDDLAKLSAHVMRDGAHDAAEGPDAPDARKLPEASPGARRHVACVDCHDPHRSNPQAAVAAAMPGALAGVWGIAVDGQRVSPARKEYEICFKCHADSANKPQGTVVAALGRARRASADANLRLVFDPAAPSFHPVAAPGKSPNVPSLKAPYSPASLVLCTDCHSSDTGPGAGGNGARGPHGSSYAPILERQYLTGDRTPESAVSYALCYKCHDRDVLLADTGTAAAATSTFRSDCAPLHRRHVVDQAAPCSACHVAHGVSREAGTERNNAHLVSFDLSIVRPSGGIVPRYETAGAGHGSCTLTCHDVRHGVDSKAASKRATDPCSAQTRPGIY